MKSNVRKYNKLVRDKIPEIIERRDGVKPVVHFANDIELWLKLKEKLIEEARELAEAKPEQELNELADISEVIDAILRFRGISALKLDRVKNKKREERGGFRNRIILDEA